jgi:type VI secretion system secreted protein Hcp
MKIVKNAVVLSLVVGAAAVAADANAQQKIGNTSGSGPVTAYVTITGEKQGVFKGDVTGAGHTNQSLVLGFDVDTQRPFDAASGQASGKRVHAPFSFVKTIDASSPQLYNAVVTGEVIKNVTVDLYRGTSTKPFFTYTLTNALITDVHHSMTTPCVAGAPCKATGIDANIVGPDEPTESVTLTFQKIQINVQGGVAAVDDWNAVSN